VPAQSAALRPRFGLLIGAAILVLATLLPEVHADASNATCLGAPTTIRGTLGNDLIYGTVANDVVSAFAGNDMVHGRRGDDRLCGGRGQDILFDGTGADLIDGGDGIDLLYLCPDGSLDHWLNVERAVASTRACT
jgi:Ca2+-binding RTX toxin-like protein